jgi:TolB-like protein/Flp pilus assembly protein TadD
VPEFSKAVFLSYASQDAEAARRICEALRAGGIEVWFDQSELRGGDAWDHRIRRQIADCALFVSIVSAHTQMRAEGYFRLEWNLADQRSHMIARSKAFIIPVCVDDTPDRGAEVPESFLKVQWTRLPGGVTPSGFVERVSWLLSPDASAAPEHATSAAGAWAASAATRMRSTQNAIPGWRSNLALLLIGAAAAMAISYIAVDRFMLPKNVAESSRAPALTSSPTNPIQNTIPERSIAVLPFVDMSETHDQEYFSDGLAEELIDMLTKVPDLRVPARTSSFYFKGKSEDIATIAQKLRVAHVLEGSVRKAGHRLRVTAQLIRADNGYHLWSETYDRDLNDTFVVQDEIAAAVLAALKLKLAPFQPTPSRQTSNIEAYNEMLLARQYYHRGDLDGIQRARDAVHKAIALDPNYAEAYASLAYIEYLVAQLSGDTTGLARAQAMADKAVALAPEQAYGYAARGFVRTQNWDWAGAQADYQKALQIDPGYADIQQGYSGFLASQGRLPEAIAAERKSTELDPLSGQWWGFLEGHLISSGDFVGAREVMRRALEVAPESPEVLFNSGSLLLLEGKAAEALTMYRKIDVEDYRLAGVATAEHALGNAQESQQALDELIAKHAQQSAVRIATVFASRGEKDMAFQWLDRAYRQHDWLLAYIKVMPFDSLRSDPRYKALLRKMNLPV